MNLCQIGMGTQPIRSRQTKHCVLSQFGWCRTTRHVAGLQACPGNALYGSTALKLNKLIYCSTIKNGSRRGSAIVVKSSNDPQGSTEEHLLPIFPLGIVALPASQCPLHIFEARYRVLFSTLLDGDGGIDEGLVSPDKPWKGTRKFGMAYYDQQAGGLASVGTVLEIQEHSTMDDGRMLIENIGRERFKIVDVVEEKPVLVCKVEYLEDEDDNDKESTSRLESLREEVATLFKDVVKLSTKLKDFSEADKEVLEPKELETLNPRDLSFWVASLFAGSPYNQQALLEENSSLKRLTVEKELLENTLKYLSAQSALQSLNFSSTNEQDE